MFGGTGGSGFSFGQQANTGGSGFLQPTSQAIVGGSLFGQSTSVTPGFSFGPATTTAVAVQPFSFGGTTTTAAQPFGFGGATTTAAQPFGFGGATTTAAQPFGFGGTTTPASQPFGFGGATANAVQPFGFGGTSTPAVQPFSFSTQPSVANTSQFNFSATITTAATVQPFAFGATATTAVQPFRFNTQSSTISTPQFNVGASITPINPTTLAAATTGQSFGFGAAPAPALAPAFSFGTTATVSSTPLSFGSTPATTTSNALLGFGAMPTTTTTASTLAATAPAAFSFGSSGLPISTPVQVATSGLAVGSTQVTSTSSAPRVTFVVTTPSLTAAGPKLGIQPIATITPAATSGLSFGTVSTSVPATSQPIATTAATGLSGALSTSGEMTYGQLEEAINKWTVELDEQEKTFLQQATQVNAWDRLLVENGEKIANLNNESERLKLDQQRLDHELDFIRAQQRELEEMLVPLEAAVAAVPTLNYQQHADIEREHTYEMAESIDAQLKRMVQDLKEIIDHVNSANTNPDRDDPVYQITKILNAHMDSLQWIDQNSSAMSRKVEEISRQMDVQRKEHERSFKLAYH